MRTVALDLGARRTDFCEVAEGGVIERTVVRSRKALEKLLGPTTAPARVAFEACREGWYTAELLRKWGHEPVMVDTTRVRQLGIGQHGRKTDRIDAEVLAVALKEGRVPQAHILSPQRQQLRFHLATRRMLVQTRAQYVSAIREITRARGIRVARCATRDLLRKLEAVELDEQAGPVIEPLKDALAVLQRQIAEMDLKLERLSRSEPVIERLMSVPGVGLVVAASFVAVIDEAGRFHNAHQVQSYLGVVPSEKSTGGRRKIGSISKAGNSYLRALLVEAAWHVLRRRTSDPLSSWGRSLARRRGYRIAVVAVARRLAGVLWALWRDGTVYDPQRLSVAGAEGVARDAQERTLQAAMLKAAADKLARRHRQALRVLE